MYRMTEQLENREIKAHTLRRLHQIKTVGGGGLLVGGNEMKFGPGSFFFFFLISLNSWFNVLLCVREGISRPLLLKTITGDQCDVLRRKRK